MNIVTADEKPNEWFIAGVLQFLRKYCDAVNRRKAQQDAASARLSAVKEELEKLGKAAKALAAGSAEAKAAQETKAKMESEVKALDDLIGKLQPAFKRYTVFFVCVSVCTWQF